MICDKIKRIVDEMTLDELCGQVLTYTAPSGIYKSYFDDFEELVKRTRPGGIFVDSGDFDTIKSVESLVNKYVSVPVIMSGDTENGPNTISDYPHQLPFPMAWGASDDEKLIEEAGMLTARICRKRGIHWSLAPLADINYNKDNPVLNTRAVSDSPNQVVKIAGAYLRGLQKEGLMAGGCKHFPGDGMDDRNPHFCTGINAMSQEEWRNTYGYVYRELIKENPGSIMIGHVAAPAFQHDEYDEERGYLPGTLSYSIMTKLLREELGYEGCIVSDALCMVGVSAVVDEDKLPVEFINAGGDMLLFAEPTYFDLIKNAVNNGIIPMERLKDAVSRILALKDSIGLLDGIEPEIKDEQAFQEVSKQIARKSIKIVKNDNGVLPLDVKCGDTVLICNLVHFDKSCNLYPSLEYIEKELQKRGINTISYKNPTYRTIEKAYNEHNIAAVLVNCRWSQHDSDGGSIRLGWDDFMTFWRGVIFRHPKVVFTSLGDPYKLYELPFLKTYVNTFSPTEESQEALVEVLLGEVESTAKNPVGLKGFFEREV